VEQVPWAPEIPLPDRRLFKSLELSGLKFQVVESAELEQDFR
jgi:hypothetical protein